MNNKKAIVVASFGTSHRETGEKNIGAIEGDIGRAFPDREVRRAYTSAMVIARLASRDGIRIDTVPQALDRLVADGFDDVCVQPTHVVPGEEYEKLLGLCQSRRGLFTRLAVGAPLLSSDDDLQKVAAALSMAYGDLDGDTALVLLGHGAAHPSNAAYTMLERAFWGMGQTQVFVGTVEAQPDADAVLGRLQKTAFQKVLLAPLMVVAGDHAQNDMAGEAGDSWKSMLESAGYAVVVRMQGMGEFPALRAVYLEHAARAVADGPAAL
jgi:sirohydrochlorin cobaltochelatase